jgi:hypothetical protein
MGEKVVGGRDEGGPGIREERADTEVRPYIDVRGGGNVPGKMRKRPWAEGRGERSGSWLVKRGSERQKSDRERHIADSVRQYGLGFHLALGLLGISGEVPLTEPFHGLFSLGEDGELSPSIDSGILGEPGDVLRQIEHSHLERVTQPARYHLASEEPVRINPRRGHLDRVQKEVSVPPSVGLLAYHGNPSLDLVEIPRATSGDKQILVFFVIRHLNLHACVLSSGKQVLYMATAVKSRSF